MIKRVLNDPLVRGSVVLIVAFGIFNFLNFVFHIIMARSLETADYGVLATLFSIMYIMGFFTESIQTVITKYSAAQKNDGKIATLLSKSLGKARNVSLIVFAGYFVLSFILSPLLEIPWSLIAINGLMVFCAFYLPITRGVLQGKQRFAALGLNVIVEGGVKILIATLLVWAGWRVYGAIIGTIIGAACAYLISVINLRRLSNTKKEQAEVSEIYSYSKPAFILIMGLMVFYSLDVILAKLIFDSNTAGVYAIASVLAKTIFIGTQPISKAMFPFAAENNSAKQHKIRILLKALGIIIPMIIVALTIFYIAPHFIIKIFSGKDIIEAGNILFYLGVGFSLLSLSNLFILYHLSRRAVRHSYFIFIPIVIEIICMVYFSNSLVQFSHALAFSSLVLFLVSLFTMLVGHTAKE